MTKFVKDYYEFLIRPYIVNHSYKVNVTHINDPHSFYVCSSELSSIDLNILEEREEVANRTDLMLNSIIVYKSNTSKKCVRGRIIRCESAKETYDIFAIDYGYVNKSVEMRDIFIPKCRESVPPLARHCKLANCEPNGLYFTDKDIEAMQIFVGNESCLMLVKGVEDGKTLVELRNTCPDDIATMLAITHFTNLGFNIMTLKNLDRNILDIIGFSTKNNSLNDIIHVRLLDTKTQYPNTYYVADVNDYKTYLHGRKEFSEYCEYEKVIDVENLKIGKSVGYKPQFSRFYERALVKNIDDETVLLSLIDTGAMEKPLIELVRAVKLKKFFTLPGIAFLCTFIDAKTHKNVFDHVMPGTDIWIKIKELGDPYIVEIVSNPNKS